MDMTPQELVGYKIQTLRRTPERRMTQEAFGELLGQYLGKQWSKQSVSEAEKGLRAFRLQELLAIADVLGTTVTHLMTPLDTENQIELSEHRTMTADEVRQRMGINTPADKVLVKSLQQINDDLRIALLGIVGKSPEEQHSMARAIKAAVDEALVKSERELRLSELSQQPAPEVTGALESVNREQAEI